MGLSIDSRNHQLRISTPLAFLYKKVATVRNPFKNGVGVVPEFSDTFLRMPGIIHEPPTRCDDRFPGSDRVAGPSGYNTRQPKLLNRVRDALRARHFSHRTEESYVRWIRRYVFFHKRATCHTFRHSFATHLLEAGYSLPRRQVGTFGQFRSFLVTAMCGPR